MKQSKISDNQVALYLFILSFTFGGVSLWAQSKEGLTLASLGITTGAAIAKDNEKDE